MGEMVSKAREITRLLAAGDPWSSVPFTPYLTFRLSTHMPFNRKSKVVKAKPKHLHFMRACITQSV